MKGTLFLLPHFLFCYRAHRFKQMYAFIEQRGRSILLVSAAVKQVAVLFYLVAYAHDHGKQNRYY